jgi:[lysine-biosynthesis-protein LysW]--L-2-aminoadipate ligase
VRIALVCSRVRVEEKMILAALRERAIDYDRIDPREMVLDLEAAAWHECDAVLLRCLSHSRAYYLSRWLQDRGLPAVSAHPVIATCGDKALTTAALVSSGLPVPRTVLAFTPDAAIEEMGYPVVLKPLAGSWGRLLARVNDRDAAEAVLEHKATLGGYTHSIFYVQEYVPKPGRDIRTLVAGDTVAYAMYRRAGHWITNTARGGETAPCPISAEIEALSLGAARAVGVGRGQPGVVAVDLLETAAGQLLVNEVNHTPEFHGAAEVVDVDIAGTIVDYVLQAAKVARRETPKAGEARDVNPAS